MLKRFQVLPALAIASTLLIAAPALPETTATIDLNHTSTTFAAKHLLISNVAGYIPVTSAKIALGAGNVPTSVEAIMDLTKIDTHNDRRDNDLRSDRFLDATHFPEMTFKSTKIVAQKHGNFLMNGELTMRGVTKPVVVNGNVSESIKDDKGRTHIGYSASATIDRTEWGVGATIPPQVVGNSIVITIEAEAIVAN